ncbi:MAG: DUF4412 domain-containing protein [Gemmatimonadota bacterium]|nr:DUF4412 domain-containing protein [Gemmatimonadota bacterium]
MKSPILIIAAVFASTPLTAQEGIVQFEGKVTGTMAADGMEVEMVQHMRGPMMRLDLALPDGGGSMTQVTNVQSGEMLMIIHEEKMWMDMASMSRMIPGFSAEEASGKGDMPTITETERVEEIAGRECRHYILSFEGDGEEIDVCAAGGLGCFIPGAPAGLNRGNASGFPGLPQEAERWIEVFGDGFFILRMDAGDASFVVHELEPGQPEEDLFTPPADYTEMKMPIR